jgi:hypothetical protein
LSVEKAPLKSLGESVESCPLVSIVILNYNGLKYLKEGLAECVKSVLETEYPNFEIIVVDNGSSDGSVESLRKEFGSKLKIVENKTNLGWSEGFNNGIRASNGAYITLLSNDMTADPNWLNPILYLMKSDPKIGLAGFKRMLYGRKGIIDGIGGELYLCGRVKPIGTREVDSGQYNHIREDVDYIGGAMVLTRTALEKTGLFDPGFYLFSEDIDLCFRIRKNGYKVVYVPNAIIFHRGQATLKGRDPKGLYLEYMSYRSRIRCAILHFVTPRLLSTFLIDAISFSVANTATKRMLFRAYWWNLTCISPVLKLRLRNGPSPPFSCKAPVLFFSFMHMKNK